MYRHFKSLALVVLALALFPTSLVSSNAAPTQATLDVWRQATYQADVTDLAISQAFCSDQTLYLATDGAGVFQSQDAGEHWRSINGGLGNLHVLALAISPGYAHDGTLFAGTDGGGVFKWNREQGRWVPAGLTGIVNTLVVSRPYAHYIRATVLEEDVFAGINSGVSKGVFNPDNGNVTWTPIMSNTLVCALALSPNYVTDMTVFAGTTSGLSISVNEGITWTQPLSGTLVCSLAISPDYITDTTIFVGTYDTSPSSSSTVSLRQALRSPSTSGVPKGRGQVIKLNVDTGAWQVCREVEGPVRALAVLPGAVCPQVILAGTQQGIFRLCQCGDTPTLTLAQEVSALAVGPGCAAGRVIFAGGSAGVLKSTDEGRTWAMCGEITNLAVNAITLSTNHPQNRTIFAATPGEGVLVSEDGGNSWANKGLIGLNVRSLIATSCYTGGCTLLAGTWAGDVLTPTWTGGVFTATCGGASPWLLTGLGCVNALAAAPDGQGGSTVFAGTCIEGVYTATFTADTNGQLAWRQSNLGLGSYNIKALGTSPAYLTDTTVFAGTGMDGIYKSTDGGASWIKVSEGTTITTVLALAISPNYSRDQTVFAGTETGIFKSTNGGARDSWRFVGPEPCHVPVTAVLVSPDYAHDQTVYAGTCGCGIFESCNGGEAWALMNTGLGNLCVRSLAITPTRPWTLLAGTEGSGVWLYTVSYKIYLPIIMRSYAHGW
jgi:photosystem II stability/assembly factor-like uncharacterized protein